MGNDEQVSGNARLLILNCADDHLHEKTEEAVRLSNGKYPSTIKAATTLLTASAIAKQRNRDRRQRQKKKKNTKQKKKDRTNDDNDDDGSDSDEDERNDNEQSDAKQKTVGLTYTEPKWTAPAGDVFHHFANDAFGYYEDEICDDIDSDEQNHKASGARLRLTSELIKTNVGTH